ncbi:MAG: site-specific DNA-methyltransferase [Beijerinckiaceae bacterium]
MKLYSEHRIGQLEATLWHGDALEVVSRLPPCSVDLIITSPPYFVGKEYDSSRAAADLGKEVRRILPSLLRCLKSGGSLCWQVGNHVEQGVLTPLDYIVSVEMGKEAEFHLRNRIIWTFGHGSHCKHRLSGRHETILWYTKGKEYYFDLDRIRTPQLYPGKRHYKGPKKGEWSGNPLGKNPGDVWELGEVWQIPNVKSNHVEKTSHPCQFPSALVQRFVLALSPKLGVVADPYVGSGTAAIASLLEGRSFLGCDRERKYLAIAKSRIISLGQGNLKVREDLPVYTPSGKEAVALLPKHFKILREAANG